jgi:hypothetical protein
MLNVITLIVAFLCIFMLSVVKLNVVAPFKDVPKISYKLPVKSQGLVL